MSLIKPFLLKPIFAALTLLIISACSSTQPRLSPYQKPEVKDISVSDSGNKASYANAHQENDTSQPLGEKERFLTQAIQLEDQALTQAQPNRALLSAAENFIQAGDINKANDILARISPVDSVEQYRKSLLQSYVSFNRGDLQSCAQRSMGIANSLTDQAQAQTQQSPYVNAIIVDAKLLASRCLQQLGNWELALSQLIERESRLSGVARSENLRYSWRLIETLPQPTRQIISETTQNQALRNRINQVEASLGSTLASTDKSALPGAPVSPSLATPSISLFSLSAPSEQLLQKQITEINWNSQSPKTIAVLLPLSSRFAGAANIVRQGLEAAHQGNDTAYRPELLIYDLGPDPLQTATYFNAAQQSGAELIIGPLGVNYVNQVIDRNRTNLPTILLGGKSDQRINNAVKFAISPEQEARAASEFANSLGFSNAAVLSDNSKTALRQVASFKQLWQELGGRIVSSTNFSASQFDHSTELESIFAISDSQARSRKLNNTLAMKVGFEAYRRQDIDFIYLVTDSNAGRLIRPQINFYAANQLPVIGSSKLFSGAPDRNNDLDLEAVMIPQSNSIFEDSSKTGINAEQAMYTGQKRQLYDLGQDAYRLASNLNQIAKTSSYFQGSLGLIGLDSNAMVVQKPTWGIFLDGELVPWDQSQRKQFLKSKRDRLEQRTGGDALNALSETGGTIKSQEGKYNAETWNQGTNSRR